MGTIKRLQIAYSGTLEAYEAPKHKWFKGRTCDEALVKTYRFPGPARRDYSMLSDNIELFPEPSE